MNTEITKAEALERLGFKSTINFTDSEKLKLSQSEYSNQFEAVQSIIRGAIKPSPKVVRLFHCFACYKKFPVSRMSGCLAFCRECLKKSRDLGPKARQNHLDRITNEIRKYVRGGLDVR